MLQAIGPVTNRTHALSHDTLLRMANCQASLAPQGGFSVVRTPFREDLSPPAFSGRERVRPHTDGADGAPVATE